MEANGQLMMGQLGNPKPLSGCQPQRVHRVFAEGPEREVFLEGFSVTLFLGFVFFLRIRSHGKSAFFTTIWNMFFSNHRTSKSKHFVGLFSMGKETSRQPKLCLFSLAQEWGFKVGHLSLKF